MLLIVKKTDHAGEVTRAIRQGGCTCWKCNPQEALLTCCESCCWHTGYMCLTMPPRCPLQKSTGSAHWTQLSSTAGLFTVTSGSKCPWWAGGSGRTGTITSLLDWIQKQITKEALICRGWWNGWIIYSQMQIQYRSKLPTNKTLVSLRTTMAVHITTCLAQHGMPAACADKS